MLKLSRKLTVEPVVGAACEAGLIRGQHLLDLPFIVPPVVMGLLRCLWSWFELRLVSIQRLGFLLLFAFVVVFPVVAARLPITFRSVVLFLSGFHK